MRIVQVLSVPLVKQEGKALVVAKDWWNGAKGLGLVQDGELQFRGGAVNADMPP